LNAGKFLQFSNLKVLQQSPRGETAFFGEAPQSSRFGRGLHRGKKREDSEGGSFEEKIVVLIAWKGDWIGGGKRGQN